MDNLNKKIPKRKKLFENFFVLGIENEYLDYIEEKELLLTPKILYTYQQDKSYNILINYYRNCCYKDGVKVTRNEIYSEIDYSTKILEENFFANPISTFIFIKAPEGLITEKYIYGIKFVDMYVFQEKKKQKFNSSIIYKYEKCYLFISKEPCFQLLEMICFYFLQIKKINYLNNLTDFSSIFNQVKFNQFNLLNLEKNNNTIIKTLDTLYNNSYSKSINIIKEELSINSNIKNKQFLSWLFEKIIWNYKAEIVFKIIIMIFLEQQILFYGNEIQLITFSCLFFSKIIKPFIWKYPIIPNLPLISKTMLSSPTPFIIGILCSENDLKDVSKEYCNLIKIENSDITITNLINNIHFNFENGLFSLKDNIEKIFSQVKTINPKFDDFEKINKVSDFFLLKINEGINKSIIQNIKLFYVKDKDRNVKLLKSLIDENISNDNEKKFFKEFCETEMFFSYVNDEE